MKQFAKQHPVSGSSFKAIGVLSDVKVGWFNWETKNYEIAADIKEQVEVLSLIGDIVLHDGEPEVHAYIVAGKKDGSPHGAHLQAAHVRPTMELVLTESLEPFKSDTIWDLDWLSLTVVAFGELGGVNNDASVHYSLHGPQCGAKFFAIQLNCHLKAPSKRWDSTS